MKSKNNILSVKNFIICLMGIVLVWIVYKLMFPINNDQKINQLNDELEQTRQEMRQQQINYENQVNNLRYHYKNDRRSEFHNRHYNYLRRQKFKKDMEDEIKKKLNSNINRLQNKIDNLQNNLNTALQDKKKEKK